MKKILMIALMLSTFAVASIARAQEDPVGVPMGEVQYGDPNAGQGYTSGDATARVTGSQAYGQAEYAAAPNPYPTGEGNSEYVGNGFDGSASSGSYQDTDTLQPGGTYVEPNE